MWDEILEMVGVNQRFNEKKYQWGINGYWLEQSVRKTNAVFKKNGWISCIILRV